MGTKEDTLVFLDEIQAYPHLLTLLKFLKRDDRYTYIASGSLLGVTLAETTSIPMGSIEVKRMYPLDFEEFLLNNGFNSFAIDIMRKKFEAKESLDETTHNKVMDLFKKYLLVGGLPDAINSYLKDKNIETKETGTRHRTAERTAKQTGELVISISQRRNIITIFKGNYRYS